MSSASPQNIAGRTIELGQNLGTREAVQLHSSLLALRGEPVSLNAAQVAKVGAQCLQILLSAQMTWDRDGLPFSLSHASSAFANALSLAGVTIDISSEPEAKL